MRQPKFNRRHIIRFSRLLDMMYKPGEIAEEIGVTDDTVYRSYLPAGVPHTRDKGGNIWIHGVAFREWALAMIADKAKKTKHVLANDEAWCMRCNQVVKMLSSKPKKLNRYCDLLQGRCSVCGTKINRAVRKKAGQ